MSLSNPSPRRMTRQGTRTLKAAYAQAARDVKKMDPAVLAAVGRSKMNGSDLRHLAHANVAALYGSNNQERFAQQLNAQAAAQVQATTPGAQHTRNPFKKLGNWNQNRKDIRAGRQALQAAYGQAKSEVKRIDPNVRQAIGHSRVTKQDLSMLSHAQLSGAIRTGIDQAAQHHYAQARASAAAVAAGAAQPQVVRQTAGQRAANAVNTASRWGKAVADGTRAVKDGAKAKAEKFAADYSERRQNPTGRNAQQPAAAAPSRDAAQTAELPIPAQTAPATAQTAEQPTPVQAAPATAQTAEQPTPVQAAPAEAPTVELPVQAEAAPAGTQAAPDLAAAKAAEAKEFHAGLNNTMPMPTAEAGPVFNGPVNDVQMATGNSGPVNQNQYGVETSRPGPETGQSGAGTFSGQLEWNNGNSPAGQQTDQAGKPVKGGPPAPGADPAMASASGAVATKPTTQRATTGPQSEATSHNRHRKPDGPER